MIVNATNMANLFKTYNVAFTAAMEAAAGRVGKYGVTLEELATIIPSTGASVDHAWLNQVRAMREWLGDRLIRKITGAKLIVLNRNFENTVEVPRTAIEDDQYGTFTPLIGMMGSSAASIWMQLGIDALVTNGNWADGNPFFCSGRDLSPDEEDITTVITNGVTTALTSDALKAAIAAMGGWVLHGGEPAEVTPTTLLVGPALEDTGARLLNNELIAVDSVVESNTLKDRLTLRVSNRLVGTHATRWFVLGEKAGIKSVGVQRRKQPVLTRMDRDTDENVFMRNTFYYGTDARGESFLTLPFLAYAGGMASVPAWAAA